MPASRAVAKRSTAKKGAPTVPILGQEFTLNPEVNAFLALQVSAEPDDSGPLYHFIINLVVEEQQRDFKNLLAKQQKLNGEDLGKIFRDMLEAVAEGNPTDTSSGSPRSARRTAGRKLSAAS